MDKKGLLTEREALVYCGFGRTFGRAWLREIGARRTFGRSVRYDLRTIDAALDKMQKTGEAS